MSFKKFLTTRIFLINLLGAFLLIAVLLFIILEGLKVYTKHGQSNPVPNFTGLVLHEAENVANKNKLKIQIIDSVYFDDARPGSVVEQVPEAGFGVKDNRTIFLTINSTNKEQVALPKLTNISFRQAQALVENCGLQIGDISYRPSEFNDLVLHVLHDSVEINQGDLIYKRSRIDFIIGRDAENEETPLPNLIGQKIEEARKVIPEAMLNLGVLIYDSSIKNDEDSLNAIIWRQRPDTKIVTSVELGTSIDLWLTVDEDKIKALKEPEF